MNRRLGAWLAVLAMALHALWPLIAQARPSSVALVPLCTVGGETHYAEVPLGKSPGEQQSAAHFKHCSLCTPGGDRAVLPTHVHAIPDGALAATASPAAEDGGFPSKSFSCAQSRAPPLPL